jgi:hypothetical protein
MFVISGRRLFAAPERKFRRFAANIACSAKGDASLDITRGRCPSKTEPRAGHVHLYDCVLTTLSSPMTIATALVALLADSCLSNMMPGASAFSGGLPKLLFVFFLGRRRRRCWHRWFFILRWGVDIRPLMAPREYRRLDTRWIASVFITHRFISYLGTNSTHFTSRTLINRPSAP